MIQKYGLYERILHQKPRKTVDIYDSSLRDQVFMKVRNLIAGSLVYNGDMFEFSEESVVEVNTSSEVDTELAAIILAQQDLQEFEGGSE